MDVQAFSLRAEIDSYFLPSMMDSLNLLVDLQTPCDMDLNPPPAGASIASAAELRRCQSSTPLVAVDRHPCRKGEFMSVIVRWLLVAAPV